MSNQSELTNSDNTILRSLRLKDAAFNGLLVGAGILCVFTLFSLLVTLLFGSALSFKTLGFSFYVGTVWDPVRDIFGAVPFFLGTIITSVIALLISIPFSISLALVLNEVLSRGPFAKILNSAIDLLAGVPSVIYGFWGLFVLAPYVRKFEAMIGVSANGVGIFSASLVLAIMIIPYSASISREVIRLVPSDLKEAALAMGATRFEMIMKVVIPYTKSGLFAGILMALGRALSETMAVTMLIGNSNRLPTTIFSPGNTLSSVIANEFAEAAEALYLSSLVQLALVLFIITAVTSFVGRIIIKRLTL